MGNSSVTSYEALMARFQNRFDSEAFAQIVSFYMSPALSVARQILSNHALAEDAVQEAFLRVIRKREQYNPSNPFSCWFFAILRNVCTDILRRQVREKEAIQKIANRSEPTTVEADEPDTLKLLHILPRCEQNVLLLRIVHEMRFRDIAAALGISEEAAKKRAQRAMRHLREKICDSESYTHKPVKLSIAP